MVGLRTCRRCSRAFRPSRGNQVLCGGCRRRGRVRPVVFGRQSWGVRSCSWCGGSFEAHAAHARFCGGRCQRLARRARDRALYANPVHRSRRERFAVLVGQGWVRCARGAACKRSELVDGERVGGLIDPLEPWHLGHADGESVGGPEHVSCNTGAPMRLRACRVASRSW